MTVDLPHFSPSERRLYEAVVAAEARHGTGSAEAMAALRAFTEERKRNHGAAADST